MKNIVNPIYETIINKWGREYKGLGSIKCFPPLDYRLLIANLVNKVRSKDPNTDIFIIVKEYSIRKEVLDYLKENNISIEHISSITYSYLSTKWKYQYKVVITIGLDERDYLIDYVMSRCKFCLFIITSSLIASDKLANIYKKFPSIIDDFSNESINAINICSPVEEHHIGCVLSEDDAIKYNEYCEFITKILNIFDSFDNITKARIGDKENNVGPEQYCYDIAVSNGWSETLDMTVGFNRQIDECYNPNKLHENATTCYNIMRDRQKLCTNNDSKLDVIADIINNELNNKKVIIISKRGEFAAKITQFLLQKGIAVGDYHDKIEDKILVDDNGEPILYKSGSMLGSL